LAPPVELLVEDELDTLPDDELETLPDDDALLDLLDIGGPVRPLGDMHRPATDQRSSACAGAQFRQCHPDGHKVSFPLLAPMPQNRARSRAVLP
jgi:hypothetical protein